MLQAMPQSSHNGLGTLSAALLESEQYTIPYEKKKETLLGILKMQLFRVSNNVYLKSFFAKQEVDIEKIDSLEKIPFVPVQMFKFFDLATCPKEDIVRIVKSSGTTGSVPSRVPLNKATIANQTKALAATLSRYLGKERKLFLVADHEGINTPNQEVSARTIGVRGLSMFAKKTLFLLKEEQGELLLNESAMKEANEREGQDVYIFGFTYIVWSVLFRQMRERGIRFLYPSAHLFHSGGWKKLEGESVSKDMFSETAVGLLGLRKENVHDFYGMAEQGGVIFVDCEQGNKHVPNFAAALVRDFRTLGSCTIGKPGLIEVLSILGDSYYSQAVLTEDVGVLVGIDDCLCGRKGEYFRFQSRVEKAELRGCGDTFREH